jgi:hypothetical protein
MNPETNKNLAAEMEYMRSIIYHLSSEQIDDICKQNDLQLDPDVTDKHSALVIAIANLKEEKNRVKIINEIDLNESKYSGIKI